MTASFQFLALDEDGRRHTGSVQAATRGAALSELRGRKLTPVRITSGSGVGAVSPMKNLELAEFLQDIAALLRAGADINSALAISASQGGHRRYRKRLDYLFREISGGRPVGESFRALTARKSAFVAGLITAGEASGDLAGAFDRAAETLRNDIKLRSDFWAAASYPLFILCATALAVVVLLLFVVPSIAPLLDEGGGSPSASLLGLVTASRLLQSVGPWLAGAALVTGVLSVVAWKLGWLDRPVGILVLDGPARALTRSLVFSRFARLLGSLLQSGVAAPNAFRLAIAAVGSEAAGARLGASRRLIADGERVSAAIAGCRGMPPAIVRLCVVGEESGKLGEMLMRAADAEEEKTLRRITRLTRALGPILIVVLGSLIGTVMLALLSAVSTAGTQIS